MHVVLKSALAAAFLAIPALEACAAPAVITYDFTGPVVHSNVALGATHTYSAVGGPDISATAGQYSGTLGSPAHSTFSTPTGFQLVGSNRGSDEQGVGVCGSTAGNCSNSGQLQSAGEINYSGKEVVQLDITGLFGAYGNFTVNADTATDGEKLGVYASDSATNIGTYLKDITSSQGDVSIAPTGDYLYFISDSSQGSGDVLLHSLSVTATSVPEPASMSVLGLGMVGLGLARRRSRVQA